MKRTSGSIQMWRTWQYWIRLVLFAASVLLVLIIGGQIGFMYFETQAAVRPTPGEVSTPVDFPVEAVTFAGGDGLALAGWSVASENGIVVILLHGYDANRRQLLWHARQLNDAGFGVLLYDLRGHGESAGGQRSNGWRDVDDVAGAVAFLEEKADAIGIYGFSVGGQVALRAAAKFPEIDAVFVDGPTGATASDLPPPATIQEQFVFRLAPIGDYMLSRQTNTPIPPAVVDILADIEPRPIFFVAAGKHPEIPGGEARLVRPFYELTESHATWWEIPDVVHGQGWGTLPQEYSRSLVDFFSKLETD